MNTKKLFSFLAAGCWQLQEKFSDCPKKTLCAKSCPTGGVCSPRSPPDSHVYGDNKKPLFNRYQLNPRHHVHSRLSPPTSRFASCSGKLTGASVLPVVSSSNIHSVNVHRVNKAVVSAAILAPLASVTVSRK